MMHWEGAQSEEGSCERMREVAPTNTHLGGGERVRKDDE